MAKKKVRAKSAKPKPRKSAKPARKPSASQRSPKQVFLERYALEHATTLRVLRAVPAGQGDFTPHPRSASASGLLYTMLFEQELTRRALGTGPVLGGGSAPQKPSSFAQGIDALDRGYHAIAAEIKKASPAKLQRTIQFPVAKGQMGDWGALDFIWFMLLDQIHHRGQMSVYVRMSGGLVPSIYGPSADDTWT